MEIGTKEITLGEISSFLNNNSTVSLSPEARKNIITCRAYLDEKIKTSDKAIYGINTGFGSLYKTEIAKDDLELLQENLVLSHACGMGEKIPVEVARLMLFLKVKNVAPGFSALSIEVVDRLVAMLNADMIPVIYEQGSLGASGDLAPLAHMSLPLLGKGRVYYKGVEMESGEALAKEGWEPLKLKSKEGLALLNGTQFMSAFACHALINAQKQLHWAVNISGLALEAFDGRPEPFTECLHTIRPHAGQLKVAKQMRDLLEGSELIKQAKKHVQDPYSFRCTPQIVGASWAAFEHVKGLIETEINAVTDNPSVFPDEDLILSGGNFHGQPIAMAMDYLALAMAEIGSLSERRGYKLISGQRDLPEFLVANPGLNSGFMIAQYTAASIVSQNKHLVHPASADTIDSSNGQEDHVSMGANAATKLYKVISNVWSVLGIEMLLACQALEFRGADKSSPKITAMFAAYRKEIPFMEQDCYTHELMQKSTAFLKAN